MQEDNLDLVKEWIDYYERKKSLEEEINKNDENGLCPVHYAAKFHHCQMLKILCEHGASKSFKNNTPEILIKLSIDQMYMKKRSSERWKD